MEKNRGHPFLRAFRLGFLENWWAIVPIHQDWKQGEDRRMRLSSIFSPMVVVVLLMIPSPLVFSEDNITATYVISGKVIDSTNASIPNAIVRVNQGATERKTVTSNEEEEGKKGTYQIECLGPSPFSITFSAPGFVTITEKGHYITENTTWPTTTLAIESIGGLWVLALFFPAIVGLFVPLISTFTGVGAIVSGGRVKAGAGAIGAVASPVGRHELAIRLLVALLNGLTWTVVLVVIWWKALLPHNVYTMQLFSPNLTFDFYVPLLGFLGALLYVFDVFRAKDNDTFKSKEFGMRIVMAPYVAIVVVVLFGKDFEFMDLSSHTGQGTLAFVSGLLVVAFLQGIIERTNEFLGRWRKNRMDYKPSPLATKFDLSEEEDLVFRSAGIRLPEQLLSREESEIIAAGKNSDFDAGLALALKRRLEYGRLEEKIGEVVWGRLAADGVRTVDAFGALQDVALQKVANMEPKLEVSVLKELREAAKKLTQA